jgi:hypothetical protein
VPPPVKTNTAVTAVMTKVRILPSTLFSECEFM